MRSACRDSKRGTDVRACGMMHALALPGGPMRLKLAALLTLAAVVAHAAEPVPPAPARQEGEGPYSQLILRNVVVISGTGAPAFGPADVVIQGNRIVQVM